MTLVLAAATLAAGYAVLCWVLPFRRCPWCRGTGLRTTLLNRMRPCRACRGAGLRLRLGRRLYNHAHRIHHDATHTRTPGGAR